MIKKLTNDVKNTLWNNIQIETNTAMPNKIIDQGWHQKGLRSQKFFSSFLTIINIDLSKL